MVICVLVPLYHRDLCVWYHCITVLFVGDIYVTALYVGVISRTVLCALVSLIELCYLFMPFLELFVCVGVVRRAVLRIRVGAVGSTALCVNGRFVLCVGVISGSALLVLVSLL